MHHSGEISKGGGDPRKAAMFPRGGCTTSLQLDDRHTSDVRNTTACITMESMKNRARVLVVFCFLPSHKVTPDAPSPASQGSVIRGNPVINHSSSCRDWDTPKQVFVAAARSTTQAKNLPRHPSYSSRGRLVSANSTSHKTPRFYVARRDGSSRCFLCIW